MINKLKNIIGMNKKKDNNEEIDLQKQGEEQNNEKDQSLENEGVDVIDEVEELKIELAEAKDKYLRLYSEFENYKRRNNKERLSLIGSASQDIITSLLPILDDFDRAKKSADDEHTKETFSEGVTLVYNKLQSTLQSKGLKKMETTGEQFDPELHEAVSKIPAASDDMKGAIIDTIDPGYMLNGKIIRHAKVVVGI